MCSVGQVSHTNEKNSNKSQLGKKTWLKSLQYPHLFVMPFQSEILVYHKIIYFMYDNKLDF